MQFFLFRDGLQLGPYPMSSLEEMHRYGGMRESDQILVDGATEWVLVPEYFAARQPAGPPPLPAATTTAGRAGSGPPPLRPAEAAHSAAADELIAQVEAGGRYVVFPYCVSVLVLTFRRASDVVFLRGDQDGAAEAIKWSVLSGVVGWWGIPWGPIWTIASLITCARGGRDVTREVLIAQYGAPAATAILARRRQPAPAGLLMKSFRVALVAVPVLFVLGIVLLVSMAPAGESSSTADRAAFNAANRQINVNHGEVAFGNSSRAIAVAAEVGRSMKAVREAGFQGGKKDGFSASRHEFLSYCDLREGQCIVLMHVPELRRFTAEAKEALAELAWDRTQAALRQEKAGTTGMKLVVGLRGVALYDRVLTGRFVEDASAKESGLTESLQDGRRELERLFDEASRLPVPGRERPGGASTNRARPRIGTGK